MTLQQTIQRLGEARIQKAIDDQRIWLGVKKHKELCACVANYWKQYPRTAVRFAYLATGMAGFKCHMDSYLLIAFAIGKLPNIK